MQKENQILLNKMTTILSKDGFQDNKNESFKYIKSLNKDYRKRELVKITVENQVYCENDTRNNCTRPFWNDFRSDNLCTITWIGSTTAKRMNFIARIFANSRPIICKSV